mgnify:CR=1 FL=1
MSESKDEYDQDLQSVLGQFLDSNTDIKKEKKGADDLKEIEPQEGTVNFTADSRESGIEGDASAIQFPSEDNESKKYIIVADNPNFDWDYEQSDYSPGLTDEKELSETDSDDITSGSTNKLVDDDLESGEPSEDLKQSGEGSEYAPPDDSHKRESDNSSNKESDSPYEEREVDTEGFPIEYDFANFVGKAAIVMGILSVNLLFLIATGVQYTALIIGALALTLTLTLTFIKTWWREYYR